ncbi:hypothetical protein E2C01_033782 [Portunus trituberculatus]|uniref:Uncharacterized protein n=1 Tax=Portunus trituberculatus TaxID=210409 RepID=A0A5B7F4C6_PORTR|nr:hypothetical protein [Portunus trituberculatus]
MYASTPPRSTPRAHHLHTDHICHSYAIQFCALIVVFPSPYLPVLSSNPTPSVHFHTTLLSLSTRMCV